MSDHEFDLEAGTTSFYHDPVYYDFEFKDRREDVAWYAAQYAEAVEVMELGVGSGRIALKAVREGAIVHGVDLSQAMLDRAAERAKKLPKAVRGNLHLSLGDMRDVDLGRTFPLVTCPFNAFQHLYEIEDIERCLSVVKRHLEPDGMFIFDVLLPDMEYLNRPAFQAFEGITFKHPTLGARYGYTERSAYDPVRQINQMRFTYDLAEAGHKDLPSSFEIELSHRCFFPKELDALLHYNGFEVLMRFGDFDNGQLRKDSESIVTLCAPRR